MYVHAPCSTRLVPTNVTEHHEIPRELKLETVTRHCVGAVNHPKSTERSNALSCLPSPTEVILTEGFTKAIQYNPLQVRSMQVINHVSPQNCVSNFLYEIEFLQHLQ